MNLPETVEVKGIRVLTSGQIAECYGTTLDCIKQNFHANRNRYVEGKHYIALSGDELKAFKDWVRKAHLVNNQVRITNLVGRQASHLYLWTEKGALLHAKSLNTDKAWEVYDYLVDFYFRAKEKPKQGKKEVVSVKTSTKPIPDELPVIGTEYEEGNYDAISNLKVLIKIAEQNGLEVKSKPLSLYKSHLQGTRIAIRKGLTLEEVNFEIAFELFQALVNYDHGDMINTPLAKYYNTQAERAAKLMIMLLNTQTA